jgi:hypothetical protein
MTATECTGIDGTYLGDDTSCVPCACLPVPMEILAVQDVEISSSRPDENFCSSEVDAVGYDPDSSDTLETLLAFDLSVLPGSAVIDSVELSVYSDSCTGFPAVSQISVDWCLLQGPWEECSVSWNSAPSCAPLAACALELPCGEAGTVSATCAALQSTVQAWVDDPSANFGLRLRSRMGTTPGVMSLGSHRGRHPARLVIHYECAAR